MAKKHSTLNVYPETIEIIEKRFKSISGGVNDTIITLDRIMAMEKQHLKLTESEALYLADALNGTMIDAVTVIEMASVVEDAAYYNNLDSKYGINVEEFREKLLRYDMMQRMAIIDGVRMFWQLSADDTTTALRRSGLVRNVEN